VTLTLAAIPGKTYLVEYCTDLAAGNWSVWSNNMTAAGSTLSISNVIGPDTQRFYRAWQLP
jgi:hypothetical protein